MGYIDYRDYKTIEIMKKSEWAEVIFASVEGFDRPVVVKRLKKANPEIYRKVADLQSVHIPKVYYMEEQGDILLVVEEYIDGRTLGAYLKEEQLRDKQKIELMLQLCDALEVLHDCIPPVIHRDIKPSNILITNEGVLKIIDFDAARQYNPGKNTSDTRLLGTIEYAAPEQFGFTQTDVRSDIYSAGVVFSELKIGKEAPFAKEWKRIVDKCTSFDPENRYRNVAELKKDLLKCLQKAKGGRKIFQPLVMGIIILALLGIGFSLVFGAGDKDTETAHITPTISLEPSIAPTATNAPELPVKNIQTSLPEKKAKRILGEYTDLEGYTTSQMDYIESEGASYKKQDNGSALLYFEQNKGYVVFELPIVVDMNYCVDVMMRIQTPVGNLSLAFYDENGIAVECFDINKTEEMKEFFFSPKCREKVYYMGLMANDPEVEDYSEFAATLSFMEFMVINPDTPKISYTMAELTVEDYYGVEGFTFQDDGSVVIAYNELNGKLKLRFPEEVDTRYCSGVSLVMKSEEGELRLNTYDSEFEFVEEFRNCRTDGVEEELFLLFSRAGVNGIGLKIDVPETEDFSPCSATVYAVNFYFGEEPPQKPLETAENPKKVVGEHTEKLDYLISDLNYVDSYFLAYRLNDTGSVSLQFKGIYDEIFYEFPEIIEMKYCEEMVVRLNSPVGNVGITLFDEYFTAVEGFYIEKTEGTQEISFSTKYKGEVAYIGFFANDGELEDYSDFIATFYYVDFLIINPETPHITYEMTDLTEESYQGMRRRYMVDGSVFMELEREKGELALLLPEPVNMRYCTGIGVVMDCGEGDLTIRLYDETSHEYGTFYDYSTNGKEEFFLDPNLGPWVGGIRLVLDGRDMDDFSDCDATVYAIKFYMEDAYWEVPDYSEFETTVYSVTFCMEE